jgi:CheY-like chemotaxis protein
MARHVHGVVSMLTHTTGTKSESRSHRRLVIADDSAEMRWLVRTALGDDFGEVVEAADGRELFWTLLRSSFRSTADEEDQVIVTDLCMPAYDGLDVLDAWRDLYPHARAVLITAFPSEAVRRRAQEVGATLLAKPFSTSTLRSLVREVSHGERNG